MLPVGVLRAIAFVAGSIATIESPSSLAAQRRPPDAASAFGPSPTDTFASSIPVAGSTRETVPSRWFATQIESNADVTAVGPFPTFCVSVIVSVVGSIRAIPPARS